MTTKAELESKHIAELHELAAEEGIERYRMLSRAELIERLSGGESKRQPRQRRERKPRKPQERRDRPERRDRAEHKPEPPTTPAPTASRPKRKRRRRWGRRRKGVRVRDLLLPAASRQTIVYGDNRAACTVLLREIAGELSDASKGPDPVALLVDPSPEELADWKREAPRAEIVSAGKAVHAEDALAQARARAEAGEDVFVLIDSLTRFAETFGSAEEARELFDAGLGGGGGSLTVVAALERPN